MFGRDDNVLWVPCGGQIRIPPTYREVVVRSVHAAVMSMQPDQPDADSPNAVRPVNVTRMSSGGRWTPPRPLPPGVVGNIERFDIGDVDKIDLTLLRPETPSIVLVEANLKDHARFDVLKDKLFDTSLAPYGASVVFHVAPEITG